VLYASTAPLCCRRSRQRNRLGQVTNFIPLVLFESFHRSIGWWLRPIALAFVPHCPAVLVCHGIWQRRLQSRPEHHTVHKCGTNVAFELVRRRLRFTHFCLNVSFDDAFEVQCYPA